MRERTDPRDGEWVKYTDLVDMLGDVYNDLNLKTHDLLDDIWLGYPFP